MKEVAWIFGNSAAGKETFVRRVTQDKGTQLLDGLGWAGKKIVASEASITYIGQFEGDPVTELREEITTEVPSLLQEGADVVVVKWQGVDSVANRIERLQRGLPTAAHRIIQIVTPDSELYERLARKSWWDDRDNTVEFVAGEHPYIEGYIAQLGGQLPVTRVSGGVGADYVLLD
jgi:hypothetical protein